MDFGVLCNVSHSSVIFPHPCLLSEQRRTRGRSLYLEVLTSEMGPSPQWRFKLHLSTAFLWVEMLPGVHVGQRDLGGPCAKWAGRLSSDLSWDHEDGSPLSQPHQPPCTPRYPGAFAGRLAQGRRAMPLLPVWMVAAE